MVDSIDEVLTDRIISAVFTDGEARIARVDQEGRMSAVLMARTLGDLDQPLNLWLSTRRTSGDVALRTMTVTERACAASSTGSFIGRSEVFDV